MNQFVQDCLGPAFPVLLEERRVEGRVTFLVSYKPQESLGSPFHAQPAI